MVSGKQPQKKNPKEADFISASTRIPTDRYNEIVEQVERNKYSLNGPLSVSEYLLQSALYCLDNSVFDPTEDITFKLPGE